jgi:hypothetical protein
MSTKVDMYAHYDIDFRKTVVRAMHCYTYSRSNTYTLHSRQRHTLPTKLNVYAHYDIDFGQTLARAMHRYIHLRSNTYALYSGQ